MGQNDVFLYRQVYPRGLLASYIDCFWTLQAPAHLLQGRERIPADGHVEMVFQLADPYERTRADGQGEPLVLRRSAILGGRSQGYMVKPLGNLNYVAIRFRPGGLAPFISHPLSELADQTVDLDLILGNAVRGWEDQLFNSPSFERSSELLSQILLSRFVDRPYQQGIQAAVQRIDALGGNVRVPELADQFGWSQKHFERLFAKSVGFVPKQYARISRFRSLSRWIASPLANQNMGRLAADFGYYDQSHLVREITSLTGATPREFFSIWCPVCRGAPFHLEGCPNRPQ